MIEDEAKELADLLVQPPSDGVQLRQGVVKAITGDTLTIDLGLGDLPDTAKLRSYAIPVVNDIVWVLQNGPDHLVLGKLGQGPTSATLLVVEGTYTGNGADTRNISVPFRPLFVGVTWTDSLGGERTAYSASAAGEYPGIYIYMDETSTSAIGTQSAHKRPYLGSSFFTIGGNTAALLNHSNRTYNYTAFGRE